MQPLEDRFGRRFRYLRLSITDVCNFRCGYCLPDGYQSSANGKDFLRPTDVALLATAFASLGTNKIRITGGEPSLRRDLPELIALCKATPGINKVALTTNGYRLPHQIDDWRDAGLDALNVSIDSLDRQQFTRITGHDRLPTILRGLDRAAAIGVPTIKINAVLMAQHNADQLSCFLHWLRDMPVTVRFIELMRSGDNAVFFRDNHLRGESWLQSLLEQGWQETVPTVDAGPARELWHPDYAGRIGFILPYSADFCASCNRLRVSASGQLHLCLFADQGHDLLPYCRAGDLDGLTEALIRLVAGKDESHYLQQNITGATRHFAQIGG